MDFSYSNVLLNKFGSVSMTMLSKNENVNDQTWKQSTPGIFVKKLPNFNSIFESNHEIFRNKLAIVFDFKCKELTLDSIDFEDFEDINDYCYIIPYSQNSQRSFRFLQTIKEEYNLKCINLSNIKGIENKILYINFRIDQIVKD